MSTTTLPNTDVPVVLLSDIVALTKPRICVLALLMASLGFIMATQGEFKTGLFISMLIGTGLVGAGSCIFNQYLEVEVDRLMWRTMNRPLPSGRLLPKYALLLAVVSSVLGIIVLLFFVNATTSILGALTLLFYLGIYTPMKVQSPLSTLVGAIPGALPPLMGWTAAHGIGSREGFLLFGILFIWQIPHFLAIGMLYKEDYLRANMPVLSAIDNVGLATSRQVLLYLFALIPLTLVPTVWGMTGMRYFGGAFILGLIFLISGIGLCVYRNNKAARVLFIISILYLPLLGSLMIWDRL